MKQGQFVVLIGLTFQYVWGGHGDGRRGTDNK